MVAPHNVFEYVRADEVAETWEGVSDALYRSLWKIAKKQKPIPNKEDTGPHDHIGFENVKEHWSDLSEEEQTLLNELAEKQV